nr:hypothetical protein [Synechocystis sp. PCC 7339]
MHLEFQTEPDETMGFRMLDYRVRVHRRFPHKTMHQVVIYLKETGSPLVYQDTFQLRETRHRYRAIRLWEQAPEPFLTYPGLLPLAVLTQSQSATERLRKVALALDKIEDKSTKANLTTAATVFGGLSLFHQSRQKKNRMYSMNLANTLIDLAYQPCCKV